MLAFLRKSVWFSLVAAIIVVVAEVMSRVDDAIKAATPLLASPSYTDLTMQDSLGTRDRPFDRYQKWKLNNAGFRSPEISFEPRPNRFRIAVIGASEAFGHAESAGKEFPSLLADLLSRDGCYEVMNTAITGLALANQLPLWQNWIARFRPSIVVIYTPPAFYLSTEPPKLPLTTRRVKRGSGTSKTTAASSRLLGRLTDYIEYPAFIQRRRVTKRIATATAGRPESWFYRSVPDDRLALFRTHLDTLIGEIRATGAVPVLATHAMRFGETLNSEDLDLLRSWRQFTPRATEDVLIRFETEAAAAVRELARKRDVPVADVAALMTGQRKWFVDFTHFNDEGASVVAKLVATTLERARVSTPEI